MSKDEILAGGQGGHLAHLLRQAGTAFRARTDEVLSALALTTPQYMALTLTAASPGLSSADLARLSLLTPQTITVIVANLKRAGLIAVKPHPEHGRIQQLHATETGMAMLARCRPAMAALEGQLCDGFDAAEMATLRRWLVAAARV